MHNVPEPTRKYRARLDTAQRIIGYEFANRGYLEVALTHPSASKTHAPTANYERLEFLGDSILGYIVAAEAFERFPELEEGGLTRIKVATVSGAMLSKVAGDLGFAEVIIFGDSEHGTGARGMHSALENVYEAIVAALYLDGGLEVARKWVIATLGRFITEDIAAEPESPKSSLQELLQARKQTPAYRIAAEDGPPHDRTFTAEVMLEGEVIGTGVGHSKKEAEAAAAAEALGALR